MLKLPYIRWNYTSSAEKYSKDFLNIAGSWFRTNDKLNAWLQIDMTHAVLVQVGRLCNANK